MPHFSKRARFFNLPPPGVQLIRKVGCGAKPIGGGRGTRRLVLTLNSVLLAFHILQPHLRLFRLSIIKNDKRDKGM